MIPQTDSYKSFEYIKNIEHLQFYVFTFFIFWWMVLGLMFRMFRLSVIMFRWMLHCIRIFHKALNYFNLEENVKIAIPCVIPFTLFPSYIIHQLCPSLQTHEHMYMSALSPLFSVGVCVFVQMCVSRPCVNICACERLCLNI